MFYPLLHAGTAFRRTKMAKRLRKKTPIDIPPDMKNRQKPAAKPATKTPDPNAKKPTAAPRAPFTENMNAWLGKHRYKVIGGLIVVWIIIRAFLFVTVAHGPLYELYAWKESDSHFFY